MGYFPKFWVHRLAGLENEFELWKEFLILLTIFEVVFQEIHGLFDDYSVLLQYFLKGVKLNQPFVCILNFPVLMLLTDCSFEVKAIDVVDWLCELGSLKSD